MMRHRDCSCCCGKAPCMAQVRPADPSKGQDRHSRIMLEVRQIQGREEKKKRAKLQER